MKKALIFVFICCLLTIISTQGLTEEYKMPENFYELMDLTYETIYRSIEVDSDHFFDIFLMDENFMALSALTRAQKTSMSFSDIKDYFKKSLEKYDLKKNFLLMVTAFDLKGDTDYSDLALRISIKNSDNQIIKGNQVEKYNNVLILSFPKTEVDRLLSKNDFFIIQFKGYDDNEYETTYSCNYRDNIPDKIIELINILME